MAKPKAMVTSQVDHYCPLCGGILTQSRWQSNYTEGKTTVCPNNHVWEMPATTDGNLEFMMVKLGKCVDCGEAMPERNMREKYDDTPKKRGEQRLMMCPKCFETNSKAWRMDKEKSFAKNGDHAGPQVGWHGSLQCL